MAKKAPYLKDNKRVTYALLKKSDVYYGTSATPPPANQVKEGSLYIQYED